MARRIVLWLARLSLLPLVGFWCAILHRLATVAENHIGWNPLLGLPFLGSICVINVLAWWRTKRRTAAAAALVVALSMIVLYLMDRYAVLMSYESWIARGMPPRPF